MSKLESALKKLSLVKDSAIVALLDASGSVSDADFRTALYAVSSLYESFPASTQFGILQFGSKVEENLRLTPNVEKAKKTLLGIKKLGGGTNTADALKKAQELFEDAINGSSKFVFLFTDGSPDNQRAASEAAKSLKSQGATIIGVGIGKVDSSGLEEICGRENVFLVENYKQLSDSIPQKKSHNCVPDSEVKFEVHQPERAVGLKDPLILVVTIVNNGFQPILAKSMFTAEGDPFYKKKVILLPKDIGVGEEFDIQVELKPPTKIDSTTIRSIPNFVKMQIIHPGLKIPYFSEDPGYEVQIAHLSRDFVSWKSPVEGTKAKILIFGPIGVGKSSLLNSIFSLWEEEYKKVAPSFAHSDHVTTRNAFYKQQGFEILDTVGVDDANYQLFEFGHLLNGILPEEFEVNKKNDLISIALNNSATAHEREIHACVFVVDQGFRLNNLAGSEGKKKVSNLREMIVISHQKGLDPFLIVTRMDEVPLSERETVAKEFSTLLSIDPPNVFPLDNSAKTQKDIAKDRILFAILHRALANAGAHLVALQGKRPQIPTPARSTSVYVPATSNRSSGGIPSPIHSTPSNRSSGGIPSPIHSTPSNRSSGGFPSPIHSTPNRNSGSFSPGADSGVKVVELGDDKFKVEVNLGRIPDDRKSEVEAVLRGSLSSDYYEAHRETPKKRITSVTFEGSRDPADELCGQITALAFD